MGAHGLVQAAVRTGRHAEAAAHVIRVREASGADHQDGKSARRWRAATFRKLAGAGVNAELLVPVRVSDDLFFADIGEWAQANKVEIAHTSANSAWLNRIPRIRLLS